MRGHSRPLERTEAGLGTGDRALHAVGAVGETSLRGDRWRVSRNRRKSHAYGVRNQSLAVAIPVIPELAAFEAALQERCDSALTAAGTFLTTMTRLEEVTDSILCRYGLDPTA